MNVIPYILIHAIGLMIIRSVPLTVIHLKVKHEMPVCRELKIVSIH